MNYFFVFQNKTYEQESRGGYLWAPQRGNLGRRVSHWEKMKSVKQGDIIIHSYKTQIMAISIAKQDVYVAKRPAELSSEWQTEGWRVDTEYVPFTNVIKTTDHKNRLLKLQPQKDAPFNILGRGNTGYLFAANRELYEFILQETLAVQNNVTEREKIQRLLELGSEENSYLTGLEREMVVEEMKAKELSPEKLAGQIKKLKPKKAQKMETIVYYRSPYIKEMVMQLAEGKCQLCGELAPFMGKDHKPYLEEHHVKRLADGGSDTIDNVVAICPNCHRKVHVLHEETDLIALKGVAQQNQLQYQRLLTYIERLNEEF